MELYFQIIATALVLHAATQLFNTVWGIYHDVVSSKQQAQTQGELLAQFTGYQEQVAEMERFSEQRTRALLIASGCDPEHVDELLKKDEAEILSLVQDTENEAP